MEIYDSKIEGRINVRKFSLAVVRNSYNFKTSRQVVQFIRRNAKILTIRTLRNGYYTYCRLINFNCPSPASDCNEMI